jgi:UDP-N-acetylglucosamine--N-acetylmuramyl-(pentapeptide) pyrophosphoryl-undecaprenol N-acetylglucosamine transferase
MSCKELRVIISGGGTGGHIFPAVAIAQAILRKRPDAQILFVGAEGRMEMEKVPAAGFQIVGLPIMGLQRSFTLKNFLLPFKLLKSMWMAHRIVKDFKPHVAIGVGGYASGPLLKAAAVQRIPTVIQEQNSYPGITNKLLASRASAICVAYQGMERYFPARKIVITGNPVRSAVLKCDKNRENLLSQFGLRNDLPVILILGGSLGARSINEAVEKSIDAWQNAGYSVIWQTGKTFFSRAIVKASANVQVFDFITDMGAAYKLADLVVSRAGAMSISELCLVAKPSILIPSPNVAEDHQTKNAMALVQRGAAELVKDSEALYQLEGRVMKLMQDANSRDQLSLKAKEMGFSEADSAIANEVIRVALSNESR